jgi:hypothetical protein
VRLTVPGIDEDDPARTLAFGQQLDVRPVRLGRRSDDPTAPLVPEQVAGYLAKYATKSADDTGPGGTAHAHRLNATIRELGQRAWIAHVHCHAGAEEYLLLGKWVHMLGFRGHFASKSHRYAITLGALAEPGAAPACSSPKPARAAGRSTWPRLRLTSSPTPTTTPL